MRRWLLWLSLAGCAGTAGRVSLEPPAKAPPPSEYVDELKKWTRRGHLIQDFDEGLNVAATFRSPEFRAAYAEKWIKTYRIGAVDAQRTRARLLGENSDTWEFHIESQAHRWEVNDFSVRKAVWRLALVDEGGREVEVKEVVASATAKREAESEFYPYYTIFSKGWTLRFPKTLADGTPLVGPQTASLTLRIAGPMGTIDLVWNLR